MKYTHSLDALMNGNVCEGMSAAFLPSSRIPVLRSGGGGGEISLDMGLGGPTPPAPFYQKNSFWFKASPVLGQMWPLSACPDVKHSLPRTGPLHLLLWVSQEMGHDGIILDGLLVSSVVEQDPSNDKLTYCIRIWVRINLPNLDLKQLLRSGSKH